MRWFLLQPHLGASNSNERRFNRLYTWYKNRYRSNCAIVFLDLGPITTVSFANDCEGFDVQESFVGSHWEQNRWAFGRLSLKIGLDISQRCAVWCNLIGCRFELLNFRFQGILWTINGQNIISNIIWYISNPEYKSNTICGIQRHNQRHNLNDTSNKQIQWSHRIGCFFLIADRRKSWAVQFPGFRKWRELWVRWRHTPCIQGQAMTGVCFWNQWPEPISTAGSGKEAM